MVMIHILNKDNALRPVRKNQGCVCNEGGASVLVGQQLSDTNHYKLSAEQTIVEEKSGV